MDIDYKVLRDRNIADILVITATSTETEALHHQMDGLCEDGLLVIHTEKNVYYAGKFGGYNIIHCQCKSMGTQDKYSSTLTTQTSLQDWPCIKFVMMIGIAFGMYEDDKRNPQHYSDVFVSEKIFPYENQRVNDDGSITYRGKCHYASNDLLTAFADYSKNWEWKNLLGEACRIIIAPVLSGEKLVDNLEFRNRLRGDLEEYRGGEMEGIGLASVCERLSIPWVLVKAICDFGDGNKKVGKKEKQQNAAEAAVDSCKNMLLTQNLSKLVERKSDFFYRNVDYDVNSIFFINYEPINDPYYLHRNIDDEVIPFILTKNCWVYGKSGMGKSTLLYRSMSRNGIKYIDVNCGVASKEDEMSVFVNIVESICEVLGIDCTVNESTPLRNIVRYLSKLLDKYYPDTKIYILIDEIPYDFNSEIFRKFAENLCKAIVYLENQVKRATAYFMLSSISSPIQTFNNIPQIEKYRQHIKFIELDQWSEEECCKLIELLSLHAHLEWDGISIKDFAKLKKYSPREIKNCLKEICALNLRVVNRDIIIKLDL